MPGKLKTFVTNLFKDPALSTEPTPDTATAPVSAVPTVPDWQLKVAAAQAARQAMEQAKAEAKARRLEIGRITATHHLKYIYAGDTTFAYRTSGKREWGNNVITFASAVRNRGDAYCEELGRYFAAKAFEAGRHITLRAPEGYESGVDWLKQFATTFEPKVEVRIVRRDLSDKSVPAELRALAKRLAASLDPDSTSKVHAFQLMKGH